jgi:serine/threonine protein kinase
MLQSEWDLAIEELEIHRSASSLPHVIPILFAEWDDETITIAMPKADEGDLWEKIRYGGLTLSEDEARRFASQLFHGISELHRARIVHADIKPHNILLIPQGDRLCVALCDFGLSRRLPSERGRKIAFSEIRGTQGYISPEICMEQDYDEKIDIFSAALIVFRLVAGVEPFFPTENFTEKLEFADDCCGHLSEECKDFLQSLLQLDPAKRLSAAEALEHAWLSNYILEVDHAVDAENELGLRFHHRRELEATTHVLQNHASFKEEPRKKSKVLEEKFLELNQLSYSSTTSTRCDDVEIPFEFDDPAEGVDHFWSEH